MEEIQKREDGHIGRGLSMEGEDSNLLHTKLTLGWPLGMHNTSTLGFKTLSFANKSNQ